jgi:hypothetical protein
MVSIDEEQEAAKAAKAAIDTLTPTAALSEATRKILREAVYAASSTTTFSSQGALTNARHDVVIPLRDLIQGPTTQERIDQAERAVAEWINRLRTA